MDLTVLAQRLGRVDGHGIAKIVQKAEQERYKTGSPHLDWDNFEPFLPVSSEKIWEPIFLPEETFEKLQQLAKQLREWDLSNPQASDLPRGILLTGASGTGKTEIAKRLAQDADFETISIKPSDVKSALLGQSAKNFQRYFAEARAQAPAILCLDDIEMLLPRQEQSLRDSVVAEMVSQFLQESDRLCSDQGVILLGITKHPDRVDPTVLSRLPEQIAIPIPGQEQRGQMLEYFTTGGNSVRDRRFVGLDKEGEGERGRGGDGGTGGRGRENRADPSSIAVQRQNAVLELDPDVDLDYYAQLLAGKTGRELKAIAERIVNVEPDSPTLSRQAFETVLVPKITGDLSRVILPEHLRVELTRTVQQFLKAFADPRLTPPAGLLLTGPPGTGKTEIARAMADLGGIHFQPVDPAEIRDSLVGGSNRNLARLFEQARRNIPAILFFDEIEGLFPSRGEGSAQHETELVNQFLQEVDGAKNTGRGIFILGATNRPEQVDGAVRSRLNKLISIPLPELPERVELLKRFVGDRPVDPQLDWQAVALLLVGKSGRGIKARVEEAYYLACEENAPLALDHFRRAVLKTGETPHVPNLVLSPPVMEQVEQILDTLRNLPQALHLGLPMPKGMLLSGPPGTGKTQIARYLAAQAGLYFRAIAPSQVKSTYYGGTLKKLQEIFADARDRSPCILFFDEIDSLFPRREEGGSQLEIELVNEFLQQVDGAGQSAAGIFILGATNRAEAVDSAVVSRLQLTLAVPLPEIRERQILLERALAQNRWQLSPEVDLEAISRLLEGKSGRDIQGVVTRIGEAYIRRVGWESDRVVLTRADFEQALLPPRGSGSLCLGNPNS